MAGRASDPDALHGGDRSDPGKDEFPILVFAVRFLLRPRLAIFTLQILVECATRPRTRRWPTDRDIRSSSFLRARAPSPRTWWSG